MLAERELTNRIMGLAVELPCTIGPSLPMTGHATRLQDGLRHLSSDSFTPLRGPRWFSFFLRVESGRQSSPRRLAHQGRLPIPMPLAGRAGRNGVPISSGGY